MTLNVKERGEHVATFRWIEVQLMETLARWVPTTPETEVKLVFGAHVWDAAQHADAFGKRTQELRLPVQHSREPAPEYVAFLRDVAATAATGRRVAIVYECVLPALERRFTEYVGRVDALLDGPTVRIIERILFDIARMKREYQALRAEVPAATQVDAGWLEEQRRREASIADVVAEQAPRAVAV